MSKPLKSEIHKNLKRLKILCISQSPTKEIYKLFFIMYSLYLYASPSHCQATLNGAYNIIKGEYNTIRTLATLKAFSIKTKTLKMNIKKNLDKREYICKWGGDGIFS